MFDLGVSKFPEGSYVARFGEWFEDVAMRLEDVAMRLEEDRPGFLADRRAVNRLLGLRPWEWFDEGLSGYEAYLRCKQEDL